ncbi:MAG: DNA polymerase domain-containing protein [Candidatus Ranarchaeia archaeon]
MRLEGWLIDINSNRKKNCITLWFKTKKDDVIPVDVDFYPSFFVWCSQDSPWGPIERFSKSIEEHQEVKEVRIVKKYKKLEDSEKTRVIEVFTLGVKCFHRVSKEIQEFGDLEIYNIDIPLEQMFFFSNSLFPFCYADIEVQNRKIIDVDVKDSRDDVDYTLPPLNSYYFEVNKSKKKSSVLKFSDKLEDITLSPIEGWNPYSEGKKEEITIEGTEVEILSNLAQVLNKNNVDVIVTSGGDDRIFPYLLGKASKLGVSNKLRLARDNTLLRLPLDISKKKSSSYFSYGQIYYRSNLKVILNGRLHLDINQSSPISFIGAIEISRLTKSPLRISSRVTIGQNFTSIQLYVAYKQDVLIPTVKRNTEYFKSGIELLTSDKGGLIFNPKIGVFGNIAEFDFTSLYPALMQDKNISPETIECSCCPDSSIFIPQIGFHVCEKRTGLIPKTLDIILKKRRIYKKYKKSNSIYNERQNALKWILVTCFGYLGFKNARFGRVEAHMATTAWSREVLLKAKEIAERNGFEVLHGIVDCLWLKGKVNSRKDYIEFQSEVTQKIGIDFDFGGVLKWIVFLPGKVHENVAVMNRFYGVFDDGEIKVRGISLRRRDIPPFFKRAQKEMIDILAEANTVKEFHMKIPKVKEVLESYREKLIKRDVENSDLFFKRRLTREPSQYKVLSPQAIGAIQLKGIGRRIYPGQSLQYLITNSRAPNAMSRYLAAELVTKTTNFDVKKYEEILDRTFEEILPEKIRTSGENASKEPTENKLTLNNFIS